MSRISLQLKRLVLTESTTRRFIEQPLYKLPPLFSRVLVSMQQIDFMYNAQADLFIAFQCSHPASHKYKYKFLKATTANIPAHILKDNRGSKLTIGNSGLLKVQHLIPVRLTMAQQQQMDTGTNQQQSRVSYIEFYVMPEEEEDTDGS